MQTYYGGKATTYAALQREGAGRARVYGNRREGYYLVFEFNDGSLIPIDLNNPTKFKRVADVRFYANARGLGCEIPRNVGRNW